MEPMVGKKFGELVVLEQRKHNNGKSYYNECFVECSCGNKKWIPTSLLKTGKRTDCRTGIHDRNLIDLTGKKFGFLTAIEYDCSIKKWKCECICGNIHAVRANTLKSLKISSCGCKTSEMLSMKRTKPDNIRIRKAIFKGYVGAAKRRGYEFQLSFDQFDALTQQPCNYCGVVKYNRWKDEVIPQLKFPVTDYYYNGIDRVDNSIGYTFDNCVPCCSICNMSKRQLQLDEWLRWVDRVYQFQHTQLTSND